MRVLCRTLDVHPSVYYDWLKSPVSKREREDQLLAQKIKQFWIESGGFHCYRNIYMAFRASNEYCGRNRVLRLMQKEGICAQRGYNTPRGYYSGKPDMVAANELNREFNVERPNQWWVTDITYIKTHEGSQYSNRQFRKLLDAYNIKPSMSRRGNCHDNAVAESFFSNLKKERIRRRIYQNRTEAK